MSRRSNLVACAAGAALANLAWLAMTAVAQGSKYPPRESRYELPAGAPPYATTLGRLIECRAGQIWFVDDHTHAPGRWILEGGRHNEAVVACFRKRAIGHGPD